VSGCCLVKKLFVLFMKKIHGKPIQFCRWGGLSSAGKKDMIHQCQVIIALRAVVEFMLLYGRILKHFSWAGLLENQHTNGKLELMLVIWERTRKV